MEHDDTRGGSSNESAATVIVVNVDFKFIIKLCKLSMKNDVEVYLCK